MDEAIIFCVHAVLKKYYDNVWHSSSTLQKQLCLNYNSLGVLIHLTERRVHDDIIYASSSMLYIQELLNKYAVWVQAVKKATPPLIHPQFNEHACIH